MAIFGDRTFEGVIKIESLGWCSCKMRDTRHKRPCETAKEKAAVCTQKEEALEEIKCANLILVFKPSELQENQSLSFKRPVCNKPQQTNSRGQVLYYKEHLEHIWQLKN